MIYWVSFNDVGWPLTQIWRASVIQCWLLIDWLIVLLCQGSLDAAELLFIKARHIDPSDASVHQHYGLFCATSLEFLHSINLQRCRMAVLLLLAAVPVTRVIQLVISLFGLVFRLIWRLNFGHQSINQSIKINWYSAMHHQQIRGAYWWILGRLFTFTICNIEQLSFYCAMRMHSAYMPWQDVRLSVTCRYCV